MRTTTRLAVLGLTMTLIAAACGDDDADSGPASTPPSTASATSSSIATTTTTTTAPTTTVAPATSEAPAEALSISDDGVATINWDLVGTVFFAPPAAGSDDPFYFVHTFPETAGFYLSVEAYTTGYGPLWTGELGMFEIDCSPGGTGICVHFDPDGDGPIGNLGADFLATGDIEIVQADEDGFEAILTDVEFSDGTTIPGPLTVTG